LILDSLAPYLISGVFIFSALEWIRLSRVSALAIDALQNTSERATAVGSRIIPQLKWLFRHDGKIGFDETFLKNAAIALGKISAAKGLAILRELALEPQNARVRNRAVQGIDAMMMNGLPDEYFDAAFKFLLERFEIEDKPLVKNSLQKAIERHRPRPDMRRANPVSHTVA
jgi:hypothetical protein